MSTLFISHSSKDNDLAVELSKRLADQGHQSLFLDLDPEKGIVAGQSWERTLYRKLRACSAVIVLYTDHHRESNWCFAEIALARMEGKQIFTVKAAPLDDAFSLPSLLTEDQFLDLRNNAEDAYARLWVGLKESDLLGLHQDWEPQESPYLGLNAFHEEHAPIFFGREDETRTGVEMLDRGFPKLVMTLGASGSGKSSLVRAGIVPRLRRMPDRWLVIEPFRPMDNPFRELAAAFIAAFTHHCPEQLAVLGDAATLEARLLSAAQSGDEQQAGHVAACPMDLARQLVLHGSKPHARVLVVVDQFEELLVLQQSAKESSEESGSRQLSADFLRLVKRIVEAEHSPITVIGTLRSDFLGLLQGHTELRGVEFESLSLGPMKPQGLRNVIVEPAKLAAIELEPELVEQLLLDTETADALPLLSFTLWALWRDFRDDGTITLAEYNQINGLQGAIAKEADALMKQADKKALRQAFVSMARLNENGEFVRKRVAWDSDQLKPVHKTLERFQQQRLLVSRWDGNVRTIEVAHEALFRSWRPLKHWLQEDREEIFLKAQIARDAEVWAASKQDSDLLWVGARLQQAHSLLKGKTLNETDALFVRKGVKKQRMRKFTQVGLALSVFIGMAVLTIWALDEQKNTASALIKAYEAKYSATAARTAAELATKDAEKSRQKIVKESSRSKFLLGNSYLKEQPRKAAAYFASALRDNPENNPAEYQAWQQFQGRTPVDGPLQHERPVNAVAFSPDGKRVLTGSGHTAHQWDAESGKLIGGPLKHDFFIGAVAFSPNGKQVLTLSDTGSSACMWDSESGELISGPVWIGGGGLASAFSPDGKRVVTGSVFSGAELWDAASGESLGKSLPHHGMVVAVAFSPDGKRVLTGSRVNLRAGKGTNAARLWDVASGKLIGKPMPYMGPVNHMALRQVNDVALSPSGNRVLTGSNDNTARLWDAESGEPIGGPLHHQGIVEVVAFSPDGKRVITGSGNIARLWDAESGKPIGEPLWHEESVNAVAFSPDGKRLLTGGDDQTARLWDVENGQPISESVRDWGKIPLSFIPDGNSVLPGSGDQTARLCEVASGNALKSLNGRPRWNSIAAVAFSPDCKRVLTAGLAYGKEGLMLWDAESGELLGKLLQRSERVTAVAFSPDGKRVLAGTVARDVGSYKNTARQWDTESGEPIGVPLKHEESVTAVAFSPDGKRILTWSDDKKARQWDAGSGEPLGEPQQHEGTVNAVAFSQDGKRMLTGADDNTARQWDAKSGEPMGEPLQHEKPVTAVAFSPDGKRVLTGFGETARLWDAESGEPLGEPLQHDSSVVAVAFSPDGKRGLTGSDEDSVSIWDLASFTGGIPAWLPDTVDRWVGTTLTDSGSLPRVPRPGKSALRERIAAEPDSERKRWLEWILADRQTRTISPLSGVTVPQYIDRRLEEGRVESIELAYIADSAHPLVSIAAAALEKSLPTAEVRANFGVKILTSYPTDLCDRAVKMLKEDRRDAIAALVPDCKSVATKRAVFSAKPKGNIPAKSAAKPHVPEPLIWR